MSSEKYEEMREKIPLYLNNSLSKEEVKEMEAFLQKHPELTEELNEFTRIQLLMKDTTDIDLPDQDRVFGRIMKNIRDEETSSTVEKRSIMEKVREFFATPYLPWAVVAAQFALILFLTVSPFKKVEYKTLTSPVASTEVMINVVFNPDAREVDIRGLLKSINGTIVNGPDETGLYIIRVEGKRLDEALKVLRKSKLVRFVKRRI